jgi:Cytochrome c oxidase subunit IV
VSATASPPPDEYEDAEVPAAGEEIHLPGPSIIPLVCAIGITLTVIGTTIDWIWSVVGLIIFIVSVVIWIRDTRRDVAALPEEHQH